MPIDPRWVAAPPEIVAAIFEAGPGPESIVAYAAVMATEAASHQMGMAASAANMTSTADVWTGVAGAANVARGTTLNMGGLEPLAGHCAKHVLLAQSAVDAYTMAAPSVIPSVACTANRDLWGVLCATNWFGQNFPGITSQDLEYFGDFWPQNSSVGLLYATTLGAIAAAAAIPPPAFAEVAPVGMGAAASLAAQAGQTAGTNAAQATTTGGTQLASSAGAAPSEASSQLSSVLGTGQQMISMPMQAFQGMSQGATQGFQSGLGPLQSLMGMFTGAGAGAGAPGAASLAAMGAPLGGGGAAAGGLGAGGAGMGGLSSSAASLTSFTSPASTFEPETAGRPTGKAGVLNAADLRSPTARAGGQAMPMSPAGMLGRGDNASGDKKEDITHARIVVNSDHPDAQRTDL
ncbi:PPE domain-containing protein [Candidatus Mycobacterium wuenschmannii]|uniref:PPE domain-containing protein n=1 Tax=Candidatus Mycobacterium wuenschmannii TaxID=3027808 RepID=A0ABY8VYL3_9MYCO|nr:PPE domain-containing protein [Candidatus Mycobacterium wuenschmannii]WIM86619.1 PPE domain-containing protein [Candidatus Mycobacterium wuenschmannii]